MKVLLDTNIYIKWIREGKYPDLLLNPFTQKYLSGIVLMELWAGCKNKKSIRTINKLQQQYLKSIRIINLSINDYIKAGQLLSDLPNNYKIKIQRANFINDIFIALNTISIGAVLYTNNKDDFKIINQYIKGLKIEYV